MIGLCFTWIRVSKPGSSYAKLIRVEAVAQTLPAAGCKYSVPPRFIGRPPPSVVPQHSRPVGSSNHLALPQRVVLSRL